MYRELNDYLAFAGVKYMKPEKAGVLADEMMSLKMSGQKARMVFRELSQKLAKRVSPFAMVRVSNWANQAQIARPHFWCYFKRPEDKLDDIALAIRLYGEQNHFGISVEVSFVERQKSDLTLIKQHRVLDLPIAEPLYYFAQEDGVSRRFEGTEENRILLKNQVSSGKVRKVLVKYDIPITVGTSKEYLLAELAMGFDILMPYYLKTKEKI